MMLGGLLWFPNLTVPDPLYALPLSMGVAMFLGGELLMLDTMATMDETQRSQARTMMRVFAVIGPALMSTLPSGIQVYFLASSVVTIAQAKALNQPVRAGVASTTSCDVLKTQAVRTLLRLPPLVATTQEQPLPPTEGKKVVLMDGQYVPVAGQNKPGKKKK